MNTKKVQIIIFLFLPLWGMSQVTLTHNIGDELINPFVGSCSEPEYWARAFTLSEFGITTDDEFVINYGNIGVYRSIGSERATIQFNIYSIDFDFPDSFSESNLIGSSQVEFFPYVSDFNPEIITVNFETPVIVPASTERILVEVKKLIGPNIGSAAVFIAGTQYGNDISWYKGCLFDEPYTSTAETPLPRPNANLYITVDGTINPISPFSIINEDNCLGMTTQFDLSNQAEINSVVWNFDDVASGPLNTSTLMSPIHGFSASGQYSVIATVTHLNGEVFNITKDVEIYELPVVNPLVYLSQCDIDLDGFEQFDLTQIESDISINYSNEIISYHESQIDAENNVDVITDPTNYSNQIPGTDTVWARVENSYGCYEISEVNLSVTTSQVPDTFQRELYQCDNGMDFTDGIATFDFTSVTTDIELLFGTGQQVSVSYYENQEDAIFNNNPIIDITNYQNTDYPITQIIYVRVENVLNNNCLAIGPFVSLYVNPLPLVNGPVILEQCDGDADGSVAFNTSGIEDELMIGQTETIVFSYIDEFGNNYTSPLPNPLISNLPILNIFATMAIPDSNSPNGACSVETTVSFIIDEGVIAHPVSDLIICDDDNDGIYAFDTSDIEEIVINGQTEVIVSYFDEQGLTLPSPLPNPFITTSQAITAHVEKQSSNICYDETTINFIVSNQPAAGSIADDYVCDDMSNDGEHLFTLADYDMQILNGQSSINYEVLYFGDILNAQNNENPLDNSYLVSSASEIIYARIQNINNTNCFDITAFELGLFYKPNAYQPQDISVCDDDSNDEIEVFDLSEQNIAVLNGQIASDNIISYHLSSNDAETNTNEISTDFTNTENPQTVYARLENKYSPDCFSITSFKVEVNAKPLLLMEGQWPICEGNTTEIIADSGYDEYLWSTGEISQSIIVDGPGVYEVMATNIYDDLRCETSKTITVVESSIASIINIETTDWSQNDNVITVFVEGIGNYEYSLDGINYQDSNEFINLPINNYTVHVRDKNGCGIVTQQVYLVSYPRYFTPNGDGFNETWQVYNSDREPNNMVYIYDRYGRLLKQLNSDSVWDGTYNGTKLPPSDYWFVLKRQNGKRYTGHFSIKY